MRPAVAGLALLLIGFLAASPALGQAVSPDLRLSPSAPQVSRGPNESAVVTFNVLNAGPQGGTVSLVAAPVEGWRFDFVEPPMFSLAANGQRLVPVKITASPGAPDAVLRVTGEFSEAFTQRADNAQADVRLSYIAPPAPVPPPPAPPTPWGAYGAVAGLVLVAFLVFQSGSVKLSLSSPHLEVTPAGSGYVRVIVRNRWWPTSQVHLRVRDLPSPAVAALSLSRVRLRRGETASIPLLVKAPVEMPDGEKSLVVQARAGLLGPWLPRRRVRLTFRAPVALGAPLRPLAPIILQN